MEEKTWDSLILKGFGPVVSQWISTWWNTERVIDRKSQHTLSGRPNTKDWLSLTNQSVLERRTSYNQKLNSLLLTM